MAHRTRLRLCFRPRLCHALALSALSLLAGPLAHAQSVDVVRPDAQGEFTALRVAGPRGANPQRFWLVVDRDPRGLLCRDRQGRAWITLRYGALLELDQPQQQLAPLWIQGKPYLRLVVKPVDILSDVRFSRDRGKATVCTVRANSSVLAPIQEDSLQQVLIRP